MSSPDTATLADRVGDVFDWFDAEQYGAGASVVPIREARARLGAPLTSEQIAQRAASYRRGLQATEQALMDERARRERLEPIAMAGHAIVAGMCSPEVTPEAFGDLIADLCNAHDATTPSPGPAQYVVVTAAEVEWLRRVMNVAEVVAYGHASADQLAALRSVLRDRDGGA